MKQFNSAAIEQIPTNRADVYALRVLGGTNKAEAIALSDSIRSFHNPTITVRILFDVSAAKGRELIDEFSFKILERFLKPSMAHVTIVILGLSEAGALLSWTLGRAERVWVRCFSQEAAAQAWE